MISFLRYFGNGACSNIVLFCRRGRYYESCECGAAHAGNGLVDSEAGGDVFDPNV